MTRSGLRDLAVQVLQASATLAGDSVQAGNVQSTAAGTAPVLFVEVPHERKHSLGKAGRPKFFTTMSLIVVARVSNANAATMKADLDRLVDQVHDAVIGSYDMLRIVQQFAEVETSTVTTAEGALKNGEASIQFHCELFQQYAPPLGEPLLSLDAKLQRYGHLAAEAIFPLPQ